MPFKAVVLAFEEAINQTENLVTKYSSSSRPPFNPEMIPSRERFLHRRIKLLNNILRWRKFTDERFGVGLLVGKLVDGCILRVADGSWDVGGAEIVKQVRFVPTLSFWFSLVVQVATMLPAELISSGVKNRIQ